MLYSYTSIFIGTSNGSCLIRDHKSKIKQYKGKHWDKCKWKCVITVQEHLHSTPPGNSLKAIYSTSNTESRHRGLA